VNELAPSAAKPPPRKDGRKALLVYMRPDLIKQVKRAALDGETTAYAIVEQAVGNWLNAEKRPSRK